MGDPKFPRRKYDRPKHPWEAERIKEENEIAKKYGLKNKREVWKAASTLRTFRGQARRLLGQKSTGAQQVLLEERQLLRRLNRLGMVGETAQLDDVLALNVETVLGRRLETLVYLKGLAGTPKQARQFISHGHVAVNGRSVRVPGYVVPRGEESLVTYTPGSPLESEAHPVRPKPRPVATEEPEERREKPATPRRRRPEEAPPAIPGAPAPPPQEAAPAPAEPIAPEPAAPEDATPESRPEPSTEAPAVTPPAPSAPEEEKPKRQPRPKKEPPAEPEAQAIEAPPAASEGKKGGSE